MASYQHNIMTRLFLVLIVLFVSACSAVEHQQAFFVTTSLNRVRQNNGGDGIIIASRNNNEAMMPFVSSSSYQHQALLQRQRKSVAPVQTMGLFGLGAPEVVVILVAAVIVIGPQTLGELARGTGKAASDWKDVPTEFKKGLEEGETDTKAKYAKPMEPVPSEITDGDDNDKK